MINNKIELIIYNLIQKFTFNFKLCINIFIKKYKINKLQIFSFCFNIILVLFITFF